jgi:hypothetical protein
MLMTEIEAIVEALTCFDGAQAARVDWEPLFPDWEAPVRQRYVHKTRTVAAGVYCPEGRRGCYQEVRENAETGEWRAVCCRESEECARRTLTRQQATVWSLNVQALCQDIADSVRTGANPYEHAPGVWECGKLRIEKKQYVGILLVVGGDGLSERLELARGIYDGAGIVIPSIDRAHNGQLAICECYGSVVLGVAEHCRDEAGRIVADSLEGWTKELAGIHGTGMKAGIWMDTPRGMTVGGRLLEDESGGSRSKADLVRVQAGIDELKERTASLPGALGSIEGKLDTVHEHVRGVPVLHGQLSEARKLPEQAALELFRQIQDILTPEQQRIWTAVRDAGGVQKDALPALKETGVVNSEPTLSRRVNEIDQKLKKHGLPPCKASGPRLRYRKSGGFKNGDGEEVPEEITAAGTDWREDPDERERIIRAYLATDEGEERDIYKGTFADIEAESAKYQDEAGMKSD